VSCNALGGSIAATCWPRVIAARTCVLFCRGVREGDEFVHLENRPHGLAGTFTRTFSVLASIGRSPGSPVRFAFNQADA
jgi:hypothetical protein